MVNQSLEVGELLKKKREERNLSFREVETATSIRMNYLQAIERGELNKLISPVYAQGFVKHYSNYLGIDGDQLVKEYSDLFHTSPSQHFDFGIGTLEIRDNPGAGVKWLPNAMWVAAFFLLVVIAWYFARFLEVL
jgi:cytoskeletal protein RodZ